MLLLYINLLVLCDLFQAKQALKEQALEENLKQADDEAKVWTGFSWVVSFAVFFSFLFLSCLMQCLFLSLLPYFFPLPSSFFSFFFSFYLSFLCLPVFPFSFFLAVLISLFIFLCPKTVVFLYSTHFICLCCCTFSGEVWENSMALWIVE